jgi:hypothetical protein
MTDLSPAAQAIDLAIAAQIQLLGEIAPSRQIVAAALRTAALHIDDASDGLECQDILRQIAAELDLPSS